MFKSSYIGKKRFDFDIGYLTKSPCRECHNRLHLPGCSNDCQMLDRVQTVLARGICSTRAYSPLEPFAVYLENKHDK